MDETSWLTCTDPRQLLNAVHISLRDRQRRLITCAWLNWHWEQDKLLQQRAPFLRTAIEMGGSLADGLPVVTSLRNEVSKTLQYLKEDYVAEQDFERAVVLRDAGWVIGSGSLHFLPPLGSHNYYEPFCTRVCRLLREVLGNPFSPTTIATEWRTDNVLLLARSIYQEQMWTAMPILGDALEEAGCSCPKVLDHCRTESFHVKGCWLLDAFLYTKAEDNSVGQERRLLND